MEWKYIAGPIIAFIFSLMATVPLIKQRLKSTEEQTAEQAKKIEKSKDRQHDLEVLILKNGDEANSKAMAKVTEALLLIAESNSKFQFIMEAQNMLISKLHARLDEHIKDSTRDLDDIKEKFVSHKYFDDVTQGAKKQ